MVKLATLSIVYCYSLDKLLSEYRILDEYYFVPPEYQQTADEFISYLLQQKARFDFKRRQYENKTAEKNEGGT